MTLPRRQDWLGAALLACGLVTLAGPAGAQDAVIHGRVINDRGEGLPVATVQIQELNVGVFTNSEGRYAMQIPAARVTGQTVMLRGPTSINAQGRGQDPLYIVDGVIINGALPDINPGDIESVEVVKGAAGASLYGARAGNGVINITTKSGRRALEGVQFSARSEG